ncbi:MAG: hypothetical protein CVU39_28500 [Chloroflexi bacterium HGW-Chloroflexi-10]|nr:MAG: hypothetical protein CVU39_28500 [Chloroflexi bacterium HGW-Chloroflexi-10]
MKQLIYNNTINHLQREAILENFYTLKSNSLHPSLPFLNKDEWVGIVRERKSVTCLATFEDEKPKLIAVSMAKTQNLHGGTLYPASGKCGVSPIHPCDMDRCYSAIKR